MDGRVLGENEGVACDQPPGRKGGKTKVYANLTAQEMNIRRPTLSFRMCERFWWLMVW